MSVVAVRVRANSFNAEARERVFSCASALLRLCVKVHGRTAASLAGSNVGRITSRCTRPRQRWLGMVNWLAWRMNLVDYEPARLASVRFLSLSSDEDRLSSSR